MDTTQIGLQAVSFREGILHIDPMGPPGMKLKSVAFAANWLNAMRQPGGAGPSRVPVELVEVEEV